MISWWLDPSTPGAAAGGDPGPWTRAGGVNPAARALRRPATKCAGRGRAVDGWAVPGGGRGEAAGGACGIGSRRRIGFGRPVRPTEGLGTTASGSRRRGRAHGVLTGPAASIEGPGRPRAGWVRGGCVSGGVPRIVVPVIRPQTKRPTGRRRSRAKTTIGPSSAELVHAQKRFLNDVGVHGPAGCCWTARPQNEREALAWTPTHGLDRARKRRWNDPESLISTVEIGAASFSRRRPSPPFARCVIRCNGRGSNFGCCVLDRSSNQNGGTRRRALSASAAAAWASSKQQDSGPEINQSGRRFNSHPTRSLVSNTKRKYSGQEARDDRRSKGNRQKKSVLT